MDKVALHRTAVKSQRARTKIRTVKILFLHTLFRERRHLFEAINQE